MLHMFWFYFVLQPMAVTQFCPPQVQAGTPCLLLTQEGLSDKIRGTGAGNYGGLQGPVNYHEAVGEPPETQDRQSLENQIV